MDTASLKNYIYENNKIEFVLDKIGCGNIKYYPSSDIYTCSNYNGDNASAINVKNNKYLSVKNWTREKEFEANSDIISLVQYNKKMLFIDAIKYIHNILGLDFNIKHLRSKKCDYNKSECVLSIFTKHCSSLNRIDVSNIQYIPERTLNDYCPLLHIKWFKEGIMPQTAKKFGIAYSYKRSRIIIPLRYWMTGELLGVNARTTIENYDKFGIAKFMITPSYPKNLNLFGLYENYASIVKSGYVVVFESEKSVLKRDSLNDHCCVALSGHTMSAEQVRILIGLNVEVIIALDKDIAIGEVRHICDKFYGIRNISYMIDKYDLIKEKDSPADASSKIYDYLFKYRVRYDENEHKKYLSEIKVRK